MACISCGNTNIPAGECFKCKSNRELLEEAREEEARAKQQSQIEKDVQKGLAMVFQATGFSPQQLIVSSLAVQCLRANPMSSAEDAVHMARKIFDLSK